MRPVHIVAVCFIVANLTLAWPLVGQPAAPQAAAQGAPQTVMQEAPPSAGTPVRAGQNAPATASLEAWRGLDKLEGAIALAELNELANRWAVEGYDEPDIVLQRLDELQKGLSAAPSLAWTRVVERTRGLVAARAGREAQAQEAAGRLSQMADRDPVAAADAAMVRAMLDDQLWRTESATGHAQEADAAYARACAGGQRSGACDHRGWWQVVRLLTLRADRQGNRLEAARLQQRANELAAQVNDDVLLAWGLSSQAVLSHYLNDPEKSRREMAQAERHARKDPTGQAMIRVLMNSAVLASARNENAGSQPTLEEAVRIARNAGSIRLEAQILASLSDEFLRAGKPREALAAVERALPVMQRFNDRRNLPVMLHNGGLARVRLGQLAQGKADLESALRLWEQAKARARIEAALNESADALAAVGDVKAALEHFHRAIELREQIDSDTRDAVLGQLKERFRTEAGQRDLELAERENSLKTTRLENQTLMQRVWMLASFMLAMAAGVLVVQLRRTRHANLQLRRSEALLKVQSERDPLTGLANRRHFREALAARQDDEGDGFVGGLILLDVDHFKRINDEHGHAIGDAVLVEVAQRLAACVRAGDVACRWGGEEFLVHTPALRGEALEALALRVLGEIGNRPFKLADGREISVTMSMAYAGFPLPPHGVTLPWEQAVNLVDMALYSAKAMGRDRAVGLAATSANTTEGLARAAADFERARLEDRLTVKVTPRAATF
ncbi:MAG TPA: GGDEF domain-containing protein [Ideonella sp.]|uniref:tetratricopeptide repeat-containing diguanylate cyclase n=1 Tax=Ideonella sp. TaxID=1929293 RepID=UPI002E315AF8|nr:GGDEF domain-containing protein [Ideonella sp.]HEX5684008.1 GGDEF domain-containing protein [Ideonella sp.]